MISQLANKKERAVETVICIYRVARGNETAFIRLLERHWPVLHELGLATDRRPTHYRGHEQDGSPLFVEIFDWVSADSSRLAPEHPDVAEIWERMDKLTEARGGRPNMEFPHVKLLDVLGQA
jgi:hypothetical protein